MAFKLLLRTHFGLILFILANFIAVKILGAGFHVNIVFIAKISFFLLGMILFFMMKKRTGCLWLYFLLYILYPMLTIIAWAVNGLLGGILAYIFMVNFNLPDKKYESGDFVFYKKMDGPISRCCGVYEIRQNEYLIIQKNIAESAFDFGHNFERATFMMKNGKGYLKIGKEEYINNKEVFVDTTLVIESR